MSIASSMRTPTLIAALALLAWIALVLVVAGRPLETDDLWWHLALGEQYAIHGPWLASDPLLRTPLGPPDPASWLFDVGLHGVRIAAGFQGLRVLHAALVLGVTALVAHLAWRASRGDPVLTALATVCFLATSWYRLIQLRPELVTIGVALALFALVLSERFAPIRARAAAAIALIALNANVHAGFLLGPALAGAGVLGVFARAAIEGYAGADTARKASVTRGKRIAILLAFALAVALLNPIGFRQHLAPFTALFEPRLPLVVDEWSSFDPFSLPAPATRMSPLAWGLANAFMLSVAGAGVAAAAMLARASTRQRMSRWAERDLPVLFAFAVASVAAMLLAIRLHWLVVLPALFWLRVAAHACAARPAARSLLRWGSALAIAALLCAAPSAGRLRPAALGVPQDVTAYLTTPYAVEKYHAHAVWFLEDAELSGQLFANYYMGGFLGFWLAPRIQTFVNGTLNFPPERLLLDYEAVVRARPTASGRGFLAVLQDEGIDLLLGIGLPQQRDQRLPARYTTSLLENAPDWILAFRNLDSAVYVRSAGVGRENTERVAAYYARQGIAFDRERGFDVVRVVREHPDWALAHGVVPEDQLALDAGIPDADPAARLAALDQLGSLQAALGLYEDGLATEQRITAQWPRILGAQKRLLFDLLHLGRAGDALRRAEGLLRMGIRDPLVKGYAGIARRAESGEHVPPLLPLFTDDEAARLLARVRAAPLRRD